MKDSSLGHLLWWLQVSGNRPHSKRSPKSSCIPKGTYVFNTTLQFIRLRRQQWTNHLDFYCPLNSCITVVCERKGRRHRRTVEDMCEITRPRKKTVCTSLLSRQVSFVVTLRDCLVNDETFVNVNGIPFPQNPILCH